MLTESAKYGFLSLSAATYRRRRALSLAECTLGSIREDSIAATGLYEPGASSVASSGLELITEATDSIFETVCSTSIAPAETFLGLEYRRGSFLTAKILKAPEIEAVEFIAALAAGSYFSAVPGAGPGLGPVDRVGSESIATESSTELFPSDALADLLIDSAHHATEAYGLDWLYQSVQRNFAALDRRAARAHVREEIAASIIALFSVLAYKAALRERDVVRLSNGGRFVDSVGRQIVNRFALSPYDAPAFLELLHRDLVRHLRTGGTPLGGDWGQVIGQDDGLVILVSARIQDVSPLGETRRAKVITKRAG